jgi:hypothetical protein
MQNYLQTMNNKFIFTLLILSLILLCASLVYFYFPKKLSEKEKCIQNGMPSSCMAKEIWGCHPDTFGGGHCHKICTGSDRENCYPKECALNSEKIKDGWLELKTDTGYIKTSCDVGHIH